MTPDTPSTRLATRLVFFVAGFAVSCWAPLVPYAKDRLAVDERTLGFLLLCLGIGSLLAMFFTGSLSSRFGTRPVILVSGLGLCITVPFLALSSSPFTLGVTLLFFGAALGSLDVAVNIHAVEVERGAGQPLMSGFHAQYSLGGVVGAMFITLLLSAGASPFACVAIASALVLAVMWVASPRLLRTRTADGEPHFALPKGVVLVMAILAAIMFLAEGTMLDWSALLITGNGLVAVEQGGIGFVLFSIAMTVMRFGGDALTARIGDLPTMVWGGLVAIGGFVVLLVAPVAAIAMLGFVLVGLGAANIVPVLFRRAGSQTVMPPGLAIAAVTT
ncbi:MAG: MFS transporter, partial [Steroidobacteraceae bacterium]|nr:MFS transporter [Steroidobacteraceae bacterium]